jgi:crotonobetainyl-CoA:carnitine CoA-transferase CaiB-like acyl-CoA transferase|tara:strand:+ start:8722 stop:11154 length:2433 start_codon:yes stop_codon:yes gene_type:complete
MLNPYRVLDLTDHRGEIAGMILGDLGADVIKVEPPGGCAGRLQGPFLPEAPQLEASLQFAAYNRNKRSILLDLASASDSDTFNDLVRSADFVLESAPPGELKRNGIGFEELRRINDRIVHVMIMPYGVDGPAAGRIANDLTISAMGGQAALQGSPERAPLRITVPQIWRHTGAEASAAALIAHHRMLRTGEAQFVDLSAQCVTTWTTMNAMNASAIQGFDFERMGSTVQMGTAAVDPVFPCADGYLVAMPTSGVLEPLLGHMLADGLVDETWLQEDWSTFPMRALMGEETKFTREQVHEVMGQFFQLHTKKELFDFGLQTDVTLAPINSVADLLDLEQLSYREAWHLTSLPGAEQIRVPGIFAKAFGTPLSIRRSAPRLDEHGDEIRAELLDEMSRSPDRQPLNDAAGDHPFAGLKVLDLTWVIAGPASVRYLSDHGARVIKVESELRPDGLRLLGPTKGEEGGWNRSQFYGEFNAGKECIQLNLKNPTALEILRQLIGWADVLIENWAPGATARLGIDYENCRKINPELIMLSTSLMGQTGPHAAVSGFGYHAAGMAGFYEVTGWPDLPPHGPWLAYTDVIAPRFISALVSAALDHRRRTGSGQHIDAAQFELALQFLAPEIMEVQTNDYTATRLGNRSRFYAPQGIYPCAGEDQWCAIAIETDEQWDQLRRALEEPDWAAAPLYATHDARLDAHDDIDRKLSEWTSTMAPLEVMDKLIAAGVPAGAVQRSSDLATDPQYAHRGFHRFHQHPVMGEVPYAGNQFRIPGYQPGPNSYAPLLGEHNLEVLKEIIGMTEQEIADAVKEGVVQ